jgi:hypothetical protein
MKIRNYLKIVGMVGSIFLLVVILSSHKSSNGKETGSVAPSIPDTIMVIFEKACTGCHADEGNGLAKGKLNFDKWTSLSDAKKIILATKICQEMKKGTMPPKSFRRNNPDLVPVDKEIERVCYWTESIQN